MGGQWPSTEEGPELKESVGWEAPSSHPSTNMLHESRVFERVRGTLTLPTTRPNHSPSPRASPWLPNGCHRLGWEGLSGDYRFVDGVVKWLVQVMQVM